MKRSVCATSENGTSRTTPTAVYIILLSDPSQLQPPVYAGELQDRAVLHFAVCWPRERGGLRAAGASLLRGLVYDRRHQEQGLLHPDNGREWPVLPHVRAGAFELHCPDLCAQRLHVCEHSGVEFATARKSVRVPVHHAEL